MAGTGLSCAEAELDAHLSVLRHPFCSPAAETTAPRKARLETAAQLIQQTRRMLQASSSQLEKDLERSTSQEIAQCRASQE